MPCPIQRGRWPPRWIPLLPFMLRLAGWVRARRGGRPALRRRAGGAAGGQGRGSRRGSGGATWRGAPLERVRTGWAELARAHGGRGGAPRHARSRPPGRARLSSSPRRPAGAPPRAPAAEPSSIARARSLAVLLDVGVSINLGLARARHAAARMAELAFSSSLILSHARLDAVVLSGLTVGRFVQQVGRNMKLIDVQLSAAISVVVDRAPVGLGLCCRAVLLWG